LKLEAFYRYLIWAVKAKGFFLIFKYAVKQVTTYPKLSNPETRCYHLSRK